MASLSWLSGYIPDPGFRYITGLLISMFSGSVNLGIYRLWPRNGKNAKNRFVMAWSHVVTARLHLFECNCHITVFVNYLSWKLEIYVVRTKWNQKGVELSLLVKNGV